LIAKRAAIKSPQELFTEAERIYLLGILEIRMPRTSGDMRAEFVDRAEFEFYCHLANELDEKSAPKAEARRTRLRRMRRLAELLHAEWKSANESEHYLIWVALHRHFNDDQIASFFHPNLEVYTSALRTAEKWTKQGKPTSAIEFLVNRLANVWHETFGTMPSKSEGGPFDDVASTIVEMATGKCLHRRNLLGGIDHYRWALALLAAHEAGPSKDGSSAPSTAGQS
jgi:hypothetical protein